MRFEFVIYFRFMTVEELRQEYIFLPDQVKECYLVYLLRLEEEPEGEDGEEEKYKDEIDDEEKVQMTKSIMIFTPTC